MKTIEEKAKAYDEALERAKNFIENGDERESTVAESIFAGLMEESEDERIRKWLIELVEEIRKANPTNADHNGMCSEALAWLEKQKDTLKDIEQKPAWSEEDEKMSRLIGNAITADVASEYLENKGIQVIDAHVWLDKLKDRVQLQPKPEWSGEDEYVFNKILNWCVLVNPTSSIFEELPKDKFVERLKFLKDRIQPQTKEEWSEKDEKMLNSIIHSAENHCYINVEERDWLKSIQSRFCPQEQWKPSEEEKAALRTAIHIMTEERSFPKLGTHLQNILNAFEGQSREEWKPSEEQLLNLRCIISGCSYDIEPLVELEKQLKVL